MDFQSKNRKIFIIIFFCIAIYIVCSAIISNYIPNQTVIEVSDASQPYTESMFASFKEISHDDLVKKIQNGEVVYSAKNGGFLYFVTSDGGEYVIEDTINLSSYLSLYQIEPETVNIEGAPKVTTKTISPGWLKLLAGCWCIVLGAILFYFGIYVPEHKRKDIVLVGGGSQRQPVNENNNEVPKVHFSDVEGIEELMSDIERIVDCLKNREKYKKMGARIPKGVVLYGPPGTGKTLIAKAIAGEADVPFFSAVGSDFVEMYVGVGAKRVRELYKKAKKAAPCIVFIDEIDAVAAQRGKDDNSERDQTINALLGELDGFDGSEGVVTICATNRLDLLDDAFKRAGRFDLKLAVGLPDKKSRLKILQIHSKNKKLSDEISLELIANKTVGFSGAELETLLNEAALSAASKNKEFVMMEDIDDAFFKIVMQGNKKKRTEITNELQVVAYHESGHTIASKLLTGDSVSSVTIIQSSSGAGGVTFRQPQENGLKSKKYLENLIMTMYAGRAAEEIFLGSKDAITTGASQDIKQATQIIKEYLAIYGMGDNGMLDLTQFSREFTGILEEASEIAKKLYNETLKFLKSQNVLLNEMASALIIKETLNEDEIDKIINDYKI